MFVDSEVLSDVEFLVFLFKSSHAFCEFLSCFLCLPLRFGVVQWWQTLHPCQNRDLFVRHVEMLELYLASEHLYDGPLFLALAQFQPALHLVHSIMTAMIPLRVWCIYSCSSRYSKLYKSFCFGFFET